MKAWAYIVWAILIFIVVVLALCAARFRVIRCGHNKKNISLLRLLILSLVLTLAIMALTKCVN